MRSKSHHARTSGRLLLSCLACVAHLAAGCSPATVYRKDGFALDGDILGHSANSIYVDFDGQKVAVPKANVESIDHPGGAAMWIGGAVLASGLALYGAAQQRENEVRGCWQCEGDSLTAGGSTIALPLVIAGGLILTTGFARWLISYNRLSQRNEHGLSPEPPEPPRWRPLPPEPPPPTWGLATLGLPATHTPTSARPQTQGWPSGP